MSSIMRVRTVITYGEGSPGLMTHYFKQSDNIFSTASAQLSIDRVRDSIIAAQNIWTTGTTFTISGDVDVLEDSDGETQLTLAATQRTLNGTTGQPLGPLAIGLLLKAKTDVFVSGHRLKGRTYFVPVNNALTTSATVPSGTQGTVTAFGTAMLNAGTTDVHPVVWSRPRPATAVGPGRPAGPAREARAGSSAEVTSYSCSPKFVVLTSRRD